MANDLSLLFIVGKGRSGSTILGDVLGSIDGIFHAGELWRLWSAGLNSAHSCSCGRPISACEVWSRVLELVAETPDGRRAVDDPSRFAESVRNLFTFGGLARAALRPARFRSTTTEVQDVLATLYRSIHAVTGARLVVDTSKWPLDPTLLVPPEGVASFGVHLVRHPSDVAASWARIKRFPDTGEAMPTFGSLHTSASWTARNLAAEWAGKRVDNRMVRVRYEDFVANPRTTVETILSSTGFPADPSSLIHDDGYVDLKPGHTVMGNPSRFDHGSVRIAPQGGTTNRLVEALTLPLRRRYSYARSARD